MDNCTNKGKIKSCADVCMMTRFGNPTKNAQRNWWQTFFNGHHSMKGVGCQRLVADFAHGCKLALPIL
jgi:hypothetical protein